LIYLRSEKVKKGKCNIERKEKRERERREKHTPIDINQLRAAESSASRAGSLDAGESSRDGDNDGGELGHFDGWVEV